MLYRDFHDAWDALEERHRAVKAEEVEDPYGVALYLYCDHYRSRQQITSELDADPADVIASLERLVEARLILDADERYLSLAVPTASTPATEHADVQIAP